MINLIGVGLNKGDITLNALEAIKESDFIIRDVNSSDFIFDYIEDKELIGEELKDNISKIELAISKSKDGHDVTFISLQDPSSFGLSNLLIQITSKYNDVDFKIYPGISSISHSASLLGAPLNDYVAINLNNPLNSLNIIENQLKHAIRSNLVIVIYNPVKDYNSNDSTDNLEYNKVFYKFKSMINDMRGENTVTGVVNSDSYKTIRFKDLDEKELDSNSILIIGNKLSYTHEGYMITSSDYVVKPELISFSRDFFSRYLDGESPVGLDDECDYLPCHEELEACDFCYCPFYPCADGCTGGEWIKDKNVWSCQRCIWIHQEEAVKSIREGLDDVLFEVDDLENKHEDLLKLRRECLFKTKK